MGPGEALQRLIVARLKADAGVAALVEGRVVDKPDPALALPYISIGSSDWVEDDADCIDARIEAVQIDTWSEEGGQRESKAMVDAVQRAVRALRADPAAQMEAHALVGIRVVSARIFQDRDGVTYHGVVTLEAHVEEVWGA